MDTNPNPPVASELAPAGVPATGRLSSVGGLLRQSFEFYRKNYVILLILAVIFFLANILPLFAKLYDGSPVAYLSPLFALAGAILSLLTSVALLDTVVENGVPAYGLSGAYRKGMRLIWAYFVIGFISGMAILGATLLLIIPGIMLSVMLSLSLYVLFAEDLRGYRALARSWQLVSGYGWAVFGRFFALGAIVWVCLLVLTLVLMMLVGAQVISQNSIFGNVMSAAFISLVEPFSIIYTFLIYRQLRERKDALSDEEAKSKKRKLVGLTVLGFVSLAVMIYALVALSVWFAAHHASLVPSPGATSGAIYRVLTR